MTAFRLFGGEAYYTGFTGFNTGNNTIVNTDGWLGSTGHLNLGIHGVMTEADHQVLGLGNAAFMGGNNLPMTGVSSKFVFVRRPVNVDPVALNQEVATFSVLVGIKDSSSASLNPIQSQYYRRDSFEFILYNSSLQQLGGIQFDNSTLDATATATGGTSRRLIWRLAWNGTAWQYYSTGYTFVYDSVEMLQVRINFRTNRWTATLGGIPVFQDAVFYTGTNAKTFGSMIVQMRVSNTFPATTNIYPGDNYMLFDDYMVRTDPVSTGVIVGRTTSGAPKVTWNEEAGYSYRLQWSASCTGWQDVAATVHTATSTADYSYTDPVSPVPAKRFYRVKRTYP